jgi:hypothetical protein
MIGCKNGRLPPHMKINLSEGISVAKHMRTAGTSPSHRARVVGKSTCSSWPKHPIRLPHQGKSADQIGAGAIVVPGIQDLRLEVN